MPQTQEIQATAMQYRALIDVQSVDQNARTFEVVYATETPVLRSPWFSDPFFEVLSMDGMRTGRMDKGAPLLDNHSRNGSVSKSVLGVVESHSRSGSERRAVIKLSKRAVADGIMEDISDGILRNVSVGYSVYKYEEMPRVEGDKFPTYRAVDWEGGEISLVPMGADQNSGVRSQADEPKHTLVIERSVAGSNTTEKQAEDSANERAEDSANERAENPAKAKQKPHKMQKDPKEGAEKTPVTANAPENREAERTAPQANAEQIRAEERERINSIERTARAFGLERSVFEGFIEKGTSFADAHKRMLEEYEKKDPAKGVRNTDMKVNRDERDTERIKLQGAFLARSMSAAQLSDIEKAGANEYRGASLMDIAKRSIEQEGGNPMQMRPLEIAQRAITQSQSDLPIILEGTARRTLLAEYELLQDTWSAFCSVGSVSNFREWKRVRMGTLGNLDKIAENAEYKNKAIPDGEFERVQVHTYGNTINLSREMIVNDDLGAFVRLAGQLGRAAARTIESNVYALLAQNGGLGPAMQDGSPLFDASHSNIDTTGAAPTVDSFERMKNIMAQQKDVSGNDFLDLRPEVGLFPLSIEGEANVVNDSQYDPNANNKLQKPNKSRNTLNQIVGTPRISGTRYYMFNLSADPALEVTFLNGERQPIIEMQEAFGVNGMMWRVRHDHGVAAVSWRGAVTNAGS